MYATDGFTNGNSLANNIAYIKNIIVGCSDLPLQLFTGSTTVLSANNLMALVNIPMDYYVLFDVCIQSSPSSVTNILRLASTPPKTGMFSMFDACPSSRLPHINLLPSLQLTISAIFTSNTMYSYTTNTTLALNTWYRLSVCIHGNKMRISIIDISVGSYYLYPVTVNITSNRISYSGAVLYGSDAVSLSTNALLSNVLIYNYSLPVYFLLGLYTNVTRGNLLGYVDLPTTYFVFFDIWPLENSPDWTNIIHLTQAHTGSNVITCMYEIRCTNAGVNANSNVFYTLLLLTYLFNTHRHRYSWC